MAADDSSDGSPQPRSKAGVWVAAGSLVAVFAVAAVVLVLQPSWLTAGSADRPADGATPGDAEAPDEASSPEGDADVPPEPIIVTREDADAAVLAAGCELLAEEEPLVDRSHYDAADTPPLHEVYTDGRPTHSGPHTAQIHPVTPAADRQIDEFATTHNLEHGSIIVWYDPDQIALDDAASIAAWATDLNDRGFLFDQGGVGILTSPYDEPGISSGGAIALRAWGTAMDCQRWDQNVGNVFVAERFGTRGIGPERTLAPYPDGALELVD